MSITTPTATAATIVNSFRWRVVDIVVASVLGVAAGLIFTLYNLGWAFIKAPFTALLPGLQAGPAALWLFAGVLGALVIRKPGAAIYVEVVAAVVSAFVGNAWGGFLTIEAGLVQGLGVEIIFAIFLYRRFNLGVAMLAGAAAGLAMTINDWILWYPDATTGFLVTYGISAMVGGALIAGGLTWLAVRALARTGALERFASGRTGKALV